jgi:Tol biopolymer transport system component
MQLSPGTRLGSYEILSTIGAGGMGEVYRARDTRLNRDVAIKVLPDAFAADPDRLARFEREAQTLAALNHPNIAHIHGVVDNGLVMELVEGEDLAERLKRGPLPLDDALAIARQVAEALDAAHERGVIHRDLKPANIKITPDGTVKVLDFGLAKALDPLTPTSAAAMNSPTFTSPAVTHMGVILGTAAYMAPEQAKGKPVDRRADIWALGVVLFEMLTGKLLYEGETVTETIAQVITQPANLDALPPATPASVRRILRRTLEKDPRKRFHSAGDVRLELEEALVLPADAGLPAKAGSHKGVWIATAVVAALLLVAIFKPARTDPSAAPSMWLDVRVGENAPILVDPNADGAAAVISPDGQMVAYLGASQNTRRIFIRRLDSLEATPLAGTEGARSHFFSPDSKWLAFFANGELRKIAVTGGAPAKITDASDARGGTWGPNDVIIFTPDTTSGLRRVSAAGGTSEEITTRSGNERTHRWPAFVPGTDNVLFITQNQDAAYQDGMIEAVNLQTKARKILVRGGTFPRYIASGHLTYVRDNTLFAVRMDAEALEVEGSGQAVLTSLMASDGVGAGLGDGAAQVAISDTGTAVMIAGQTTRSSAQLVITDRTGKPLYSHPEKRDFRSPRFSPDGERIALQMIEGRQTHIFVFDVARRTFTKVTFDGSINGTPAWSRDGKTLAFFSDRLGNGLNIFTVRSDGGAEPVAVTNNTNTNVPFSFAADGKSILGMQQGTSSSALDVVLFSLTDKSITPLVKTPANEVVPAFSPDDKWIAYTSDETTRNEVYVRPYPVQGGRWVLSPDGGIGPVWTKQGREIVYVGGAAMDRVMSVEVSVKDGAIHHGTPQLLFEYAFAHPPNASWMDASSDGSRFVLLREDTPQSAAGLSHLTLITNFFEHVRKTMR